MVLSDGEQAERVVVTRLAFDFSSKHRVSAQEGHAESQTG
jgi:hypothetical protein